MTAVVTCTRCGKAAEGATAPRCGPWMCLTCSLVTSPISPEPMAKPPTRMAKWPILVGALVLVGGGLGALLWARQKHERETVAARYPIAATPAEAKLLETEAAKWRAGKSALLAAIQTFQPAPVPEGDKPCPLAIAVPPEAVSVATMEERMKSAHERDPDESLVLAHVFGSTFADRVAGQLQTLLATAERARFHSVRGRHLAIAATALPLVVMKLGIDTSPGIEMRDTVIEGVRMGQHEIFVPGHRVGTAYVFDKQTGELRCAGEFDASSSESVEIVQGEWGSNSARDALEIDLEDNTIKAIAKAVHAVE